MNRAYVGIDLGTSSVKVLLRHADGSIEKSREKYDEISPEGWWRATVKALSALAYPENVAIGLSSQVGTYIVNDTDVISWNSPVGQGETEKVRAAYSAETFIREISMPHPKIASYPIPRLTYIREKYGDGAKVCQPKDFIGKMLTGAYKTDPYSWRGLANLETKTYSAFFLREVGNPRLPAMEDYTALLGTVREDICAMTGIPSGTPVCIGLNDFFASLHGMGMQSAGDLFDITGTSEHLGVLTDTLSSETPMVAGPFTENYVHYGVTASAGPSLEYAMGTFGDVALSPDVEFIKKAPVFLPYLKGERAPIFDADAMGTYFGITDACTPSHMAYAALEGVVFSIYHIYESLGAPAASRITVSGGAAENALLNRLKAELFGLPVIKLSESDTSALGAAMAAAKMCGENADFCRIRAEIKPTGEWRDLLLGRFAIYKELYPILKNTYKKCREVQL